MEPEVQTPRIGTVNYRGEQGPLFWLSLKTSLLTLLTLGIYRFWAKTRIRKYLWSAIAPAGDPLEYTGRGLEKLLGFLIAVAFLAVYLGLIQLLLSFASLSVFDVGDDPEDALVQIAATYISFLAVLPFIFYAQYRARRYILSRTRWRGIRFGVEAAAWGYVWRALAHLTLTILTLGILLPRQTFWLEKYQFDRTWYGNTQFHQGGSWTMLFPAMKHIFIGFGGAVGVSLIAGTFDLPLLFLLAFVGYIWGFYGIVHYSIRSFELLAQHKVLGDVEFESKPRPSRVFWTAVLGSILASTCAGLVFSAFAVIAVAVGGGLDGLDEMFDPLATSPEFSTGAVVAGGLFVLGYIAMLLLYGVFAMIFVTQPILEHYCANTRIINLDALAAITQRDRDEMIEAEGFADALDVGAAI